MNKLIGNWELRVGPRAEKDLARLPHKAATAALEFILGPLLINPHRVGKTLRAELVGRYSARRGPYRIIYEINETKRIVQVLRIDHRADIYRRQ